MADVATRQQSSINLTSSTMFAPAGIMRHADIQVSTMRKTKTTRSYISSTQYVSAGKGDIKMLVVSDCERCPTLLPLFSTLCDWLAGLVARSNSKSRVTHGYPYLPVLASCFLIPTPTVSFLFLLVLNVHLPPINGTASRLQDEWNGLDWPRTRGSRRSRRISTTGARTTLAVSRSSCRRR